MKCSHRKWTYRWLLRYLRLLDHGEVFILCERIMLLVAHQTTFLRAHIPVPVEAHLLFFPFSHIKLNISFVRTATARCSWGRRIPTTRIRTTPPATIAVTPVTRCSIPSDVRNAETWRIIAKRAPFRTWSCFPPAWTFALP